ncbi:MAG: RNA polymerase sigma factor [Actinomycetia bacterium]|nr:RNA polymerase sigma factor [Actinomycetes bacterium]
MHDTQAFVDLYAEQYPRVLAYAWRRLGTRADAEDCAAEVFRLAWQRDEPPGVGWLFVTARNLVYAEHRSRRRLTETADRLAREEPQARPDPAGRAVMAGLERLSETQRELLMAFYWDGLSGAECARLAGCSVPALWVRLHRARAALKTVLVEEPSPSCVTVQATEPVYEGGLS